MTKDKSRTGARHSRRGVALIVVVGFLAVLILVAVSFSISMRVERLAAKNFSDVISCRQHAQSALAHAMRAADAASTGTMLLNTPNHILSSSAGVGQVDPPLFSGDATNYVPGAMWAAARGERPEWIEIRDNTNAVVGRYAFQVIDCSGLLDANFGFATNLAPSTRNVASNAFDLWLDPAVLPEIPNSAAARALKEGRFMPGNGNNSVSPWYELTSIADMWKLLEPLPYAGALLQSFPSSFITYSRFPAGWLNDKIPGPSGMGIVSQALFIGWSPAEWNAQGSGTLLQQKRDPLTAAFVAMGLPSDRALDLAKCVLDYADSGYDGKTDDLPQNAPAGDIYVNASTEATPLINEFLYDFSLTVDGTTGKKTIHIKPYVELWYPFIGRPADKRVFELVLNSAFSGGLPGSLNVVKTSPVITVPPPGAGWVANTYRTLDVPEIPIEDSGIDDASAYVVRISAALRLVGATTPSSLADGVRNLELKLNVLQPKVPLLAGDHHKVGVACNDPRFNAYSNNWFATELGDAGGTGPRKETLLPAPDGGRYNDKICTALTDPESDFSGSSSPPWIYISTNGCLGSIGEMGLIAYDSSKPWQTIRLLGPGYLPVLGRFTLTRPAVAGTVPAQRGLVNINSWIPSVMTTVFVQAPTDEYPGESAGRLSTVDATAIGTLFSNRRFTNVSDIATISPDGKLGTIGKLRAEGIIRNSSELLGVRQNLYVILVAAQTVSPTDSNSVTSEQKAVALVWRDPYPSGDGPTPTSYHHPSFVRWFHWLTD